METKPGVRTTEFWITLFTAAVGFLPASGIMDYLPQRTGGILLAASTVGYAIARGLAKLGQYYDPNAPDPSAIARRRRPPVD